MDNFRDFIDLYPVSKTIRQELIPVGDTMKRIQESGILRIDKELAASYKLMKKTIDEYHKNFIEESLAGLCLDGLEIFYELYTADAETKAESDYKDRVKAAADFLRAEIAGAFKANEAFNDLDKKELITKRLEPFIAEHDPSLYYDPSFRDFTSYFRGFNDIRMNLYSDEEKSSAVAYRLINQNLPVFIQNMSVYQAVKEALADDLATLASEIRVDDIEAVFGIDYYGNLLTQTGISFYNTVISGYSTETGKVQGLNEYINLYNQRNRHHLPSFKPLYKQLLSDRVTLSWIPDRFDNTEEVIAAINEYYADNIADDAEVSLIRIIQGVLDTMQDCDLYKIYVRNDTSLTGISNSIFGRFDIIGQALEHYHDTVICPDFKAKREAARTEKARKELDSARERFLTKSDYYSVGLLQDAVHGYAATLDPKEHSSVISAAAGNFLVYYFRSRRCGLAKINEAKEKADAVLRAEHQTAYRMSDNDKLLVKDFLDAVMDFLHFVKPLRVKEDAYLNLDVRFYGSFAPLYEDFAPFTKLYDKVRNFCTQKAYSDEKYKLNFGSADLLSGWDVSKEGTARSIILIKDDKYYLGIIAKGCKKALRDVPPAVGPCYSKMNYRFLPGAFKTLPKSAFAACNEELYAPSAEILRIREEGTFKKSSKNFSLEDCHKMIDFYKKVIDLNPNWQIFNFQFSPTESYADISEFFREVDLQSYKLTFTPIPESYIDALVSAGKLYLFQIWNKDFSQGSHGKPNLYTMYIKAMFSPRNLQSVVYKLCGGAEIFYRPASIDINSAVVHKAGVPMKSKNPLRETERVLPYDIVKDKRYTKDSFFLHVPIMMNFASSGRLRTSDIAYSYIKENPDIKILSVTMGERSLVTISLIDRDGHVVNDKYGNPIQYSLNSIVSEYKNDKGKDVPFVTPYSELLQQKAVKRDNARRDWGDIDGIKNLKRGYTSQIVSIVSRLMVEHNAILAIEDLSGDFTDRQRKVEKAVYQQLTKALIDKLGYLVFKNYDEEAPGGLYKALQLTNPFESFQKLGRQNGMMLFVNGSFIGKMDPVTGFVNFLDCRYKTIAESRAFFGSFKGIRYNPTAHRFEFTFDYADFTNKDVGPNTVWTACSSNDERYAFDRTLNNNKGGYTARHITKELQELFDANDIDYNNGDDLISVICGKNSAKFFSRLQDCLAVLLAVRYYHKDQDKTYIISPIADKNGRFFNSTVSAVNRDGLPTDASTNAAYNLARKALLMVERLDESEDRKHWVNYISNADWLEYAQSRFN